MRKLEIVQATLRCLSRHGLAGTNYETVGQECGMKRPHVAYHFPEWDELIRATVTYAYSTGQAIVADALRETETPKQALQAYIEGTFLWLKNHSHQGATLTLLFHLATVDKKYRRLNTEMKRVGTQRIAAILSAGHKRLNKAQSDRLWQKSVLIHGLIVGRCLEVLSTNLGFSHDEVARQTFEQAWAMVGQSVE